MGKGGGEARGVLEDALLARGGRNHKESEDRRKKDGLLRKMGECFLGNCVCVCVRACAFSRALVCVYVRVCVCEGGGGGGQRRRG